MDVISVATINTNGITAHTRVGMLADFIQHHDFDVIFIQEGTSPEILNIRGYETLLNIGTSMRGPAVVAKSHHNLMNVLILPFARVIAANV